MKNRILIVMDHGQGGGAQRVVSILLGHLSSAKEDVHLCLLTGNGHFITNLPEHITVHRLGATRTLFALPSLWKLVRKLRPRVVFSSLWLTDLACWLVCRLSMHRIIVIFRCCTFPTTGLAIQPFYLRLLIPFAYRNADLVIATTQSMQQDLANTFGVTPSKIRRLLNPVDLELIRSRAGNKPIVNTPYLSAMGRLIYDKGFDVLLRAFALLPTTYSSFRLVILGNGPLEGELRSLAETLGIKNRVDFLGFILEPWHIVQGSRLFLLTSRREGFPNALLEAMALGIPCIASNCKSGPSEIIQNEVNGILVPVDDVTSLAQSMIRLLENPELAFRIGDQAGKEVGKYAPKAIAEEFMDTLRGAYE